MESVIKWQTGEPKETGRYLITTKTGIIFEDFWFCSINRWEKYNVLAWCLVSEIEPYKEKDGTSRFE